MTAKQVSHRDLLWSRRRTHGCSEREVSQPYIEAYSKNTPNLLRQERVERVHVDGTPQTARPADQLRDAADNDDGRPPDATFDENSDVSEGEDGEDD